MKPEWIQKELQRLVDLPLKEQYNELNLIDLETLEALAVVLYEDYLRKRTRRDQELFSRILSSRKWKLNESFVWSEENQKAFLRINDEIADAFEKAHAEAVQTAKELEKRIADGDTFLNDYEFNIRLGLYLTEDYYPEDSDSSIGFVLSEPYNDYYPISASFSHSSIKRLLSEESIYLDKSFNWNIEYFGDVFNDSYIGYGIHALLDSGYWSFKDILSINRIWSDVIVTKQNYREIN